jgi:predicted HTH transcriptional regulator
VKGEEIKRLVAKSENAAVEFKRARGGVPADFWPSYSSFANTDGGVIILGVREKDGKREIEGLADDSELGVKTSEVGVIGPEVGVIRPEVGVKASEVREKTGVSDDVKAGSVQEKPISDHEKSVSDEVNRDFEVLTGAYRSDFRDNARQVLYAFAETPEADISSVAKGLGFSTKSVWRAIRAMKAVGLFVREGGDKGGRWIVKKAKI